MSSGKTPIAIIGDGKMGQAVAALASDQDCEVVVMITEAGNPAGKGITRATLKGAKVAIEFTQPDSAVANIKACIAANIPVVVGTTGWYNDLPTITKEVSGKGGGGALLWSANFSIGVNILLGLAARAGELTSGKSGFDAHIVETHHNQKKDAPSGTAQILAAAFEKTSGRKIPITSVRTGSVPGTHELILDAPFEEISVTHVARDRRVFAEGALQAAKWLVGKTGVFTMADFVASSGNRK